MFQTPVFWKATWNTILLRILTVPVGCSPGGSCAQFFRPARGRICVIFFPFPLATRRKIPYNHNEILYSRGVSQ